MNAMTAKRLLMVAIAMFSMSMLYGCAGYEVNTKRGNIPGYYIRSEMQEADRAVEAARQAGKDKTCPVEFKAAEDAKNKAYDVFRNRLRPLPQ
jgi:OOP family OmpA-OmpF porin